jgi:hypothetical protein
MLDGHLVGDQKCTILSFSMFRLVKSLVPAVFAVVSTHQTALDWMHGGPLFVRVSVTHKVAYLMGVHQ